MRTETIAADDNAELVIHRYEHGGARIYFEHRDRSGRDLVIDIYDDTPAERREAIIEVLLAAGVLKPRCRGT